VRDGQTVLVDHVEGREELAFSSLAASGKAV